MKTTFLILCLAFSLSACGGTGPRTAEPATPTTGGAAPVAPTDTPPPISATPIPPVDTPTGVPTAVPTAVPTEAPSETPTASPTLTVRTRPTPTSAGLLDFQVYLAGCKNAPTADKPGNLLITISVEATGGNGVYRYFHFAGPTPVEEPDKFIDINMERGFHVSGRVLVTSGDGQEVNKEYDFPTTNLECAP